MNQFLLLIKKILSSGKVQVVLFLLFILVASVILLSPETKPGSSQQNIIKVKEDINKTSPGQTTLIGKNLNEKSASFGDLLSTTTINDELKSQKFAGENIHKPIEVVTNSSNTILAIVEATTKLETNQMENLRAENNLPEPDFEMYVLGDYYVKAYVFLAQGIVYEASESGGQVFHIVNFAPTDKTGFLKMFPNRYSETYVPTKY